MWETTTFRKGAATLRITSMPGKHAPGPLSLLLPPVMGSLLEFQIAGAQTALRLYITGDTLIHEHLREIPHRYPEIDLALLHLGGTRILGLMVTMDAHQGVEAIQMIRPHTTIPVHYNDYTVFKSPLRDFQKAVRAAGLEKKVVYLSHGETYGFEVPASRWQQHGRGTTTTAAARPERQAPTSYRGAMARGATNGAGRRGSGISAGLALLGGAGIGAALMCWRAPRKMTGGSRSGADGKSTSSRLKG